VRLIFGSFGDPAPGGFLLFLRQLLVATWAAGINSVDSVAKTRRTNSLLSGSPGTKRFDFDGLLPAGPGADWPWAALSDRALKAVLAKIGRTSRL